MSFLHPITRRGRYSIWHAVGILLIALIAADFATCLIQGSGHGSLIAQLFAADQYVRPVAGSDGSDGLDWATARATITTASTGLDDGDTVFVERSPEPTSIGDALWTAGDRSVVLSTACTALMYACDGTGIWLKVDANCTPTQSTTMKEGTHSASLAIGASATTGVMATANLNADLDCSGYQQISLWVRTNAALTANYLALALYSDDYPTAALTNLTGKAYIPAIPAANLWTPVTVDYGGALGTVRTIALIAETDPGTVTLLIDDILACKAAASADSLTLTSLISKNTAGEPWFAIGSINGTAVELESINAAPSSSIGSYGGVTETVETYKRECWATTPASTSTAQVQVISDSGSDGSPITIAGGYEAGKDVTVAPTGSSLSIFQGSNGYGYGMYANARSYVSLSRLGAARYYNGILTLGITTGHTEADCLAAACGAYGVYIAATVTQSEYSDLLVSGCVSAGIYAAAGAGVGGNTVSDSCIHGCSAGLYLFTGADWLISGVTANACTSSGIRSDSVYHLCRLVNCTADAKSIALTYGLYVGSAGGGRVEVVNGAFTADNGVWCQAQTDAVSMSDTVVTATTETGFLTTYGGDTITSTNHDDTAGSHFRWEYGATYNTTQAVRHTADGWAWQLSPTNAARSSTWPLRLPIGQVYLASGVATTVTAWMRRSDAGLTLSLVCPGGQITGIAADVSDTVTAAADDWEEMSIVLTSTETGVVNVECQAYGGTAYSGYVDDISSDKSGTFTGLDLGTGSGPVWINSAAGGTTYQWGGAF